MTTHQHPPIDVYARVSRKGDKQQRSTGGQVSACRVVLGERGLPVGEVFIDDGKSAWNPRVVRPDWDALMARLESGVSGGVIVFDLERFTRQPKEGERLIDAAERGLAVLDSDGEFDLTTASGKKAFRDAMAAAAYYSDRLSDRIKRGKKAKAISGEVDQHRSFGFEADGVTVRDDEAVVLRALTEHVLHGDSHYALADWLTHLGITTAAGKTFTPAKLRELLSRPRNAGQIVHRDVVVGRLPGEPIISPEDHARLLAKYAARRPGRPASPAYLCSGVAFCGLCGKRLAGRPRRNVKPYADGEPKRVYWCSKGSYGGCQRIVIDQRALDAAARALTIRVLSDPRHAAQIEAAAADRAEEARDLDALIATDEATALALADRLGRGDMDLARYDAATGPLDKRLKELRARRDAVDVPHGGQVNGGDWAARWDAGLPAERRDLLKMALRGKVLSIGSADPHNRADVTRRITLTVLTA